ncbi:MAG: diguanylate cyclase [Deltaproteobacteria bacterium]|nr:diguanylate cyclase [Deltaproteobacteria bacterium]
MRVNVEALLTVIAQASGYALVVLDEAGKVVYWSPRLAEISGLESRLALGRDWSEITLFREVADLNELSGDLQAESMTWLSGMEFSPVSDPGGAGVCRVGMLRVNSTSAANGETFPFSAENVLGIPSQRVLREVLQRQIAYYHRYQTPFSLLFLRIKNVNTFVEVLGRDSWEVTNRAIFDQIMAIVRMGDYVGLYDDSTFWVILTNSTPEGAHVVADKIKRLTASMQVETIDVFLSVAIAAVSAAKDDDVDGLIGKAGQAVEEALRLSYGPVSAD